MQVSRKFYKNLNTANPLLSNVFCADPYGFEYKGRFYIYGTNDNQQYKLVGDSGKNTYEHIKSLVCFSTDDLVNWTYHGVLDVQTLAPFILSAWSPAIVYKKEDDGYYNNEPYVDRSALLRATLNSLAMTNVASVLNSKKHKKSIKDIKTDDKEENIEDEELEIKRIEAEADEEYREAKE